MRRLNPRGSRGSLAVSISKIKNSLKRCFIHLNQHEFNSDFLRHIVFYLIVCKHFGWSRYIYISTFILWTEGSQSSSNKQRSTTLIAGNTNSVPETNSLQTTFSNSLLHETEIFYTNHFHTHTPPTTSPQTQHDAWKSISATGWRWNSFICQSVVENEEESFSC